MRSDQRLADSSAKILDGLADVAHGLSHARRLTILNLLAQSDKTVTALAALTGASIASTSAHLQALAGTGLVRSRRMGRQMHYTLANSAVLRLIVALREAGEAVSPQVVHAREDVFDTSDLRETTPRQLADDVRRGRVTLVDLRPVDEFSAGRLPGARSVPVDRVKQSIAALPSTKPVAAYCRGPYCVSAVTGVRRLRQHGINATRLPFGVVEWQVAGYRVERGGAA